jgi:hypothetical protein
MHSSLSRFLNNLVNCQLASYFFDLLPLNSGDIQKNFKQKKMTTRVEFKVFIKKFVKEISKPEGYLN